MAAAVVGSLPYSLFASARSRGSLAPGSGARQDRRDDKREGSVRGMYSASSWIALAAATVAFCGAGLRNRRRNRAASDTDRTSSHSSTPTASSRIRAPIPSSAPKTIQAVAANHPAEILNTVPGVNVQMNSGQELLVAIRSPVLPAGAGQGSFLILENGIPTRAAGFGNVNALFEAAPRDRRGDRSRPRPRLGALRLQRRPRPHQRHRPEPGAQHGPR